MTSNTTNLWCWCGAVISQRRFGLARPTSHWADSADRRTLLGARPQCSQAVCCLLGADKYRSGCEGRRRSRGDEANRALRTAVAALQETPISIDEIPSGTTSVFSPRHREVLDLYVKLVDSAKTCSALRWHSVSIIRSSRSC